MVVNILLAGFFVFSLVYYFIIEAWTVANGQPTISQRVQDAGKHAPILVVAVCVIVGGLLVHFFG